MQTWRMSALAVASCRKDCCGAIVRLGSGADLELSRLWNQSSVRFAAPIRHFASKAGILPICPPLATILFNYLRLRSLNSEGNIFRRCPFDAHFDAALIGFAYF